MSILLLTVVLACGSDKGPGGDVDGDGGVTDDGGSDGGGTDGGTDSGGSDGGSDDGEAVPRDDSFKEAVPDEHLEGVSDAHGGVPFRIDPDLDDPLSAWADCVSTISPCARESGGDYTTCVADAPTCGTDEPWTEGPCCPADCVAAFSDAVAGGASQMDAYLQVFALAPTCFPGVAE